MFFLPVQCSLDYSRHILQGVWFACNDEVQTPTDTNDSEWRDTDGTSHQTNLLFEKRALNLSPPRFVGDQQTV